MRKYLFVWLKSASLSAQSNLQQKGGALMFITGKFIRFGFFLLLLILIGERVSRVSGYTLNQMITFFLFFNFFDIFGQAFFRGLYWFRQQVISGEFDFRLAKPMSPLFQALTRHTDVLDVPLFVIIVVALVRQAVGMPLQTLGVFIVLTAAGMIIVTAIHVFIAGLGVITTEVDHTMMIYRDLSSMARVPTDIYAPSIRAFLTFIIPIGIAYTIPAKAFLGILSSGLIIYSIFASVIFFAASLVFWRYALTQYSSASS